MTSSVARTAYHECSAGENTSERWTVLTTLPSYIQVMDLLVTQALTRPQTCYEPSNTT
jgi:hypothetical protein